MITEDNHTKEFDEVMRQPPNAITRYGHWVLLLLLLALGLAAATVGRMFF
jgi:hypothetical protein